MLVAVTLASSIGLILFAFYKELPDRALQGLFGLLASLVFFLFSGFCSFRLLPSLPRAGSSRLKSPAEPTCWTYFLELSAPSRPGHSPYEHVQLLLLWRKNTLRG